MKFSKLIVADLGYGLHICPASVTDELLPNVAVVQTSIVKFKVPESNGNQWDADFKRQKEYAHLFAAAPDLLDACKHALNVITEVDGHDKSPLAQNLKSAIKQVEGSVTSEENDYSVESDD